MKRILFILTLLTCVIFAQAQNPIPSDSNFAITQSVANAPTTKALTNVIQAKKGFINGVYTDTTQANLPSSTVGGYRLKYFPGAQIFTSLDNKFWIRDNVAKKWIAANSEGGGSVTQINDSTILVCNAAGVCTTIHLGNTNNYYFITIGDTATAVVSCDTAVVTCVGDSCYQTTLCDTTLIPGQAPFPVTVYQNGLRKIPNTNEVVMGDYHSDAGASQLLGDTWTWTNGFQYNIQGRALGRPVLTLQQTQWSQVSSSIMQFNHLGNYTEYNPSAIDNLNPVNLYVNYINPYMTGNGVFAGDTIGFMYDRIGYALMTNSQGDRASYLINSNTSKQTGIMLHTFDTSNTDAVTIFGNQVPNNYGFSSSPFPTTTLLDSRIAVFKTDKDIQFPGYPDTRNDGVASMALYTDADGNLKLGTVAGGGSITFDNDTVFICSFGDNLCDTFITTLTDPIQYVTVINDTLLQVCDTNGVCQNVDVGGSSGGGVGVDEKFFTPNQIQATDTYHQMSKNFSLGINLITSVSGVRNYNFLNSNTVSGSENVVWGRNMVVSGNTNFIAATDGTMSNGNYSAVFGDANDVKATASMTGGFGNDNFVENSLLMGNDNVLGALSPGGGTANQYTGSWAIGSQIRTTGSNNGTLGYYVQNTGVRAITIGSGFGSTRLVNSMTNVIAFGMNSDSATMRVFPAAGTTGSIGVVSIGTAAPTATRFEVVDNTVGSNSIVKILSTSTAASGNSQRGLDVQLSGTNVTSSQVTSSVYGVNTHAGTGSINYGGRFEASGGDATIGVFGKGVTFGVHGFVSTGSGGYGVLAQNTSTSGGNGLYAEASGVGATTNVAGTFVSTGATNNYAIIVPDASGNVGIGLSNPTATRLHVVDNTVGANSIVNVTSTSTAAASSLQKGINVSLSGANANSTEFTYGIYSTNAHTGTTSINYAIYGTSNSGTGGNIGVFGGASGTGATGVRGDGTGWGGQFTSAGIALEGASTGTYAGNFYTTLATTNTKELVMAIGRQTTGTAANGIGGTVVFNIESDNGLALESNRINWEFTTVANATRVSTLTLQGVLSGSTVDLLTLAGDGSVKLRPISAAAASAITPTEGMLLIVNTTDATFTSTGFWGYSGGAWGKLTN